MPTRAHKYRGEEIVPCQCERYSQERRWTIVSYVRGMRYFESQSLHCATLAEARAHIDERLASIAE